MTTEILSPTFRDTVVELERITRWTSPTFSPARRARSITTKDNINRLSQIILLSTHILTDATKAIDSLTDPYTSARPEGTPCRLCAIAQGIENPDDFPVSSENCLDC